MAGVGAAGMDEMNCLLTFSMSVAWRGVSLVQDFLALGFCWDLSFSSPEYSERSVECMR